MKSNLRLASFSLLVASLLCGQVSNAQPLPVPSHIIVLIEENQAYSTVMGTSYAPNLNALAAMPHAANFTSFYAIEHPSQPNYLDFFSGQNQGTTGTDNIPTGTPFSTPNLGANLLAAGKTFITYSEQLPDSVFMGSFDSGASGDDYARKHNPCTDWICAGCTTIPANQLPAHVNQSWRVFPDPANYSTLPTVSFVVPNETDDMHDGTYPSQVVAGDTWYQANMSSLLSWVMANNSLLIVTFDEDDDAHGNNIPTIFYGPMVETGTYTQNVNLFNLLRTIEQMYGTAYCAGGADVDSSAIHFCWVPGYALNTKTTVSPVYSFKVMPNPASNVINFNCVNPQNLLLNITVTDEIGRIAGKYSMTGNSLAVNTSEYPAGAYVYNIVCNNATVSNGKFVVTHN